MKKVCSIVSEAIPYAKRIKSNAFMAWLSDTKFSEQTAAYYWTLNGKNWNMSGCRSDGRPPIEYTRVISGRIPPLLCTEDIYVAKKGPMLEQYPGAEYKLKLHTNPLVTCDICKKRKNDVHELQCVNSLYLAKLDCCKDCLKEYFRKL